MRNVSICVSYFALAGLPAAAMAPAAGVQSMTSASSQNYVAGAADSDMYEMQSSRLALPKAKNKATKDFAREMIADHMQTTKSLMSALPKTQPKVMKPGKTLSEPNAAKVAALRAASSDNFDALYMQRQAEAHRAVLALHLGYAQDGQDPALRQVATSAVPIIQKHTAHVQGAAAGGM